nr:MFS transporter [Mycolicibacterium madagascariense]
MVTSIASVAPVRSPLRPQLPGLLSLALASCLAVTTEMLPVGLLPAIGASFGVANSSTGLLVSLYAVLVAALAVPMTHATARFARKPLLLTTLCCYALSNLLVSVAPTFAVVAAGRGLGGLTHALFFSLCIGYVPRLVTGAQVGRALAIATGGASAGLIVGVPLATSVGTALGWRASFGALAALSVLTLVLVAKVLPGVSNAAPTPVYQKRSGRTQLVAVVSSNALTYLGQFTLYTFVSVLFLAAGARPEFVGPLLLLCGICGLAGLGYAAGMVDRRPRRTTFALLTTAIAAVLAVGVGFPLLVPVIVAAAVWNGAFGGVASVFQAAAVRTHAVNPELAGAWVNASANTGIAGGAAIGAGFLPLIGLGGLPWVCAAVLGLGLATSMLARRAFPSHL